MDLSKNKQNNIEFKDYTNLDTGVWLLLVTLFLNSSFIHSFILFRLSLSGSGVGAAQIHRLNVTIPHRTLYDVAHSATYLPHSSICVTCVLQTALS